MKRHFKILLTIACAFSFSDCNNSLEQENPGATSIDDFYQSEEDVIMASNAMYSSLHAQDLWNQFQTPHETLSDDVIAAGGGDGSMHAIDKYVFASNNPYLYSVWRGAYNGIFRSNVVLARVPEVKMDEALKARILGEAKFLRAFYYFMLVTNYGDVPLLIKPIDVTKEEEKNPVRTPQAQVYAQIEKDLQEAVEVLPVQYDAGNIGRATKGAALGYLGKVYLYQQKFSDAAVQFKKVMDLGIYDLFEDYKDNFNLKGENGKESVFEVQFSHDVNPGLWGETGGQSSARGMLNGSPVAGAWHNISPNKWLVEQFEEKDTTRLYATVLGAKGTKFAGKPFYEHIAGYDSWEDVKESDLANQKYQLYEGNEMGDWQGSGINFRLMRYADILLMYAEAINESTGPNSEAYAAINKVRARALLDPLPAGLSKDEFREKLIHERLVEFATEDIRWYDLVRWRRAEKAFTELNAYYNNNPKVEFDPSKHYLLPIPQQERDVNPNLTQNPGY